MSFRTAKPDDDSPGWFKLGIICSVKNHGHKEPIRDNAIIVWFNDNHFIDEYGNYWDEAKPCDFWEPLENEIVACFGFGNAIESMSYPMVGVYRASDNGHHIIRCCSVYEMIKCDNVARLQYPDHRVIDCACTVEELKKRTDWI